MKQYHSQLRLKVHAPLKLVDLKFKFLVYNKNLKKYSYSDVGTFDAKGFSKKYNIFNPNTDLFYEIFYREELIQRISAKAYSDNQWSMFDLKTTVEQTKKLKENIKEIYLNDGEVAWYLIKKPETALSWSQRVYKQPLVPSDWDILRSNNPHLLNLVPLGVLQPGQVVVLSNSTTAKTLAEYKKQAKRAQDNLEMMQKDKEFDALFFAQNYEFFYDALERDNTRVIKKDAFDKNNHPLTIKFDKNKKDKGFFEQKMAADAALIMAQGQVNRVYGLHAELVKRYSEANIKGTPNASIKFSEFKNENAKIYNELNQESLKKFLRWDQSIKTNNMRRMLNQSAFSRDNNYKGGIKDYVKKMGEVGKVSKYLKGIGYLSIVVDVMTASVEVYDAKPEDKARTTVVETAKVTAGIGSGVVLSAIVIGLATGGTGLLVLGIVALSGVAASKAFSDVSGDIAGGVYDIVADK